jgi:hypothetical protein
MPLLAASPSYPGACCLAAYRSCSHDLVSRAFLHQPALDEDHPPARHLCQAREGTEDKSCSRVTGGSCGQHEALLVTVALPANSGPGRKPR